MRLSTSRRCLLLAMLAALLVTWESSVKALAGDREAALVGLMKVLRHENAENEQLRMERLQDAIAQAGEDLDKKLANFALGVHYLSTDFKLAKEHLAAAEQVCREDDRLLPIIRFYVATAHFRGGFYKESATLAQALRSAEMGEEWRRATLELLIDSYAALNDHEGVVNSYAHYRRDYPVNRRDERYTRLAAEARERRGDAAQAIMLLEELAENYPASEGSRWAFNKLLTMSCDLPQGVKPRYVFSRRFLIELSRNAGLDSGIKEFIIAQSTQALEMTPGNVRFLTDSERADLLFRSRFYDAAYAATLAVYENEQETVANSTRLPYLLFELGRINLRRNEMMLASRYFSIFLANYPRHRLHAKAREYLGDAYKYLSMSQLAAEQYALAASKHKEEITRFEHFWNLYRAANYQAALKLLETPGYVGLRKGDSKELLTYWHGRILDHLGRKQEATGKFQKILDGDAGGYYSQLVAARYPSLVKKSIGTLAAPSEEIKSKQGDGARTALSAKLLPPQEVARSSIADLAMVDQLLRVGMRDAAAFQFSNLKWGEYNQKAAFTAASSVAHLLQDYQPSRRIRYFNFSSLRFIPTRWDEFLRHQLSNVDEWKIYYPLAYESILTSVADKVDVNKLFVLSIMRAESFYNKEARSIVGARGLMQIMPYTGVRLARLLGDDAFDVAELSRPEVNISYGSYYLDKLLRYYSGNKFVAAAAYNGGPHNVNRWIEACKGCSTEEFVESIPFRETRRYVREVMKNFAQYARLYEGETTWKTMPDLPKTIPEGEQIF